MVKKNIQIVRLPVIHKYVEFDRTKDFKYEDGDEYLKKLEMDIKKNGLKEPLILAVNKETQRAYLTEGKHRIICLENLECIGYLCRSDIGFSMMKIAMTIP